LFDAGSFQLGVIRQGEFIQLPPDARPHELADLRTGIEHVNGPPARIRRMPPLPYYRLSCTLCQALFATHRSRAKGRFANLSLQKPVAKPALELKISFLEQLQLA
jgi:hypothetical protein